MKRHESSPLVDNSMGPIGKNLITICKNKVVVEVQFSNTIISGTLIEYIYIYIYIYTNKSSIAIAIKETIQKVKVGIKL